jgi:hypothetical protein
VARLPRSPTWRVELVGAPWVLLCGLKWGPGDEEGIGRNGLRLRRKNEDAIG